MLALLAGSAGMINGNVVAERIVLGSEGERTQIETIKPKNLSYPTPFA